MKIRHTESKRVKECLPFFIIIILLDNVDNIKYKERGGREKQKPVIQHLAARDGEENKVHAL
jgi:hypothetical protein